MKNWFVLLFATATSGFAQNYVNTFDTPPVLGGNDPQVSQPGAWYIDRTAPTVFTNVIFDGGSALDIGVSATDYQSGNSFNNLSGRKYYLSNSGVGSTISAQLYIPSAWADLSVQPSMWATAWDDSGNNTGFPSITFYSPGMGSADAGFYGYDNGYIFLSTPVVWDAWNTFSISMTSAGFVYDVNGVDLYTTTSMASSTSMANIMFEDYNSGTSYDAYWGNLSTPSPTSPDSVQSTPEATTFSLLALGGLIFLGLKKLVPRRL